MENLLPIYSGKSDSQSLGFAALFYRDLLTGNIDQAMEQMKAYFASIPYPEGGKSVLKICKRANIIMRLFSTSFFQ